MIQIRPANERGHVNFGWLDSYHSFSFGEYYDPRHKGFSKLRVINEDRVSPGEGFDTHGHKDMEIISYVLSGELAHKDSMGTGSTIVPGDVQRMTAGTGVLHSEFNASKKDLVHFLQIWILPERTGLAPSYEQKNFSEEEKLNRLKLIASRDGRENSITVHQDASIYACKLEPQKNVELSIGPDRQAWVQVARGKIMVNGTVLGQGDGAGINQESQIKVEASEHAEFLIFDLP